MPVTYSPIATGLHGAIGSKYILSRDQLVFVEFANGQVSSIDNVRGSHTYRVIASGLTQPEDIAVSADGSTAWVTERIGNFTRVNLGTGATTVVASGMNAPHQIALDESTGVAYVVEFASPSHLWRIDLTTGAKTSAMDVPDYSIGLVLSGDLHYGFVTSQDASGHGHLTRIDLVGLTSTTTQVWYTAAPLFFMTWADSGQTAFFVPQRATTNTVERYDVSNWPSNPTQILPPLGGPATPLPTNPSSIAVVSPTLLTVCCDDQILLADLGIYAATDPLLMGLGSVPKTSIDPNGYATTPLGWIFPMTDAVFGGTVPIIINHDRARTTDGAQYYQVLVDGVPHTDSWTDYKWDPSIPGFALKTISPVTLGSYAGCYPVRNPPSIDLWYTGNLGDRLDTSSLSNGTHTIAVRAIQVHSFLWWTWYSVAETDSTTPRPLPAGPYPTQVVIDNRRSLIEINSISEGGMEVDACAIVQSPPYPSSDQWTFGITVAHPQHYLRDWGLEAWWGNNQSSHVDGASYPGGTPSPHAWDVPAGTSVPASPWHASVAGDPSSTHCAHTFVLWAWDRVTDGTQWLHYGEYHESVTIMLT